MAANVRPGRTAQLRPRVQAASTACPGLDPRAIIGGEVSTARRGTSAEPPVTLSYMEPTVPAWAKWCADPALEPWTVGLEEEVMLLEPDGSPAWRSEDVLELLPPAFAEHARGETHGLALELSTSPHATVAAATSQLRFLRAGLNAAA